MKSICFLRCLYAFASTSHLFNYLRRRYDQHVIQGLNQLLSLKGQCVRTKESIRFLKRCLEEHVTPKDIKVRVKKSHPKHPGDIEKAFIRDEIEKCVDHLEYVVSEYRRKLSSSKAVSFFDRIRFFKLLNQTSIRLQHQIKTKKDRTLHWLIRTQVGNGQLRHSTITNLSEVQLTEIQKNVLCRGLNFHSPKNLQRKGERKGES